MVNTCALCRFFVLSSIVSGGIIVFLCFLFYDVTGAVLYWTRANRFYSSYFFDNHCTLSSSKMGRSNVDFSLVSLKCSRDSFFWTAESNRPISIYVKIQPKTIHLSTRLWGIAHLHRALRTEGNMLDINWLQAAKELVEFNTWWNFSSLCIIFRVKLSFETAKSLGGKSVNELVHSL